MPTGYTADIKDGISFQTFAMNCARAFGATITLRDAPSGGDQIPERFEPSDYHAKALATARKALADLEQLIPGECERFADDDSVSANRQRLKSLRENKNLLAAYRTMLDNARCWISPSKEHDGLKAFMIAQIEESIKWDDSSEFLSKPTVRLTGQDWLDGKKAKALKDIEYHKNEHAKEVERTNQRNEWVRLLRESLAVKP